MLQRVHVVLVFLLIFGVQGLGKKCSRVKCKADLEKKLKKEKKKGVKCKDGKVALKQDSPAICTETFQCGAGFPWECSRKDSGYLSGVTCDCVAANIQERVSEDLIPPKAQDEDLKKALEETLPHIKGDPVGYRYYSKCKWDNYAKTYESAMALNQDFGPFVMAAVLSSIPTGFADLGGKRNKKKFGLDAEEVLEMQGTSGRDYNCFIREGKGGRKATIGVVTATQPQSSTQTETPKGLFDNLRQGASKFLNFRKKNQPKQTIPPPKGIAYRTIFMRNHEETDLHFVPELTSIEEHEKHKDQGAYFWGEKMVDGKLIYMVGFHGTITFSQVIVSLDSFHGSTPFAASNFVACEGAELSAGYYAYLQKSMKLQVSDDKFGKHTLFDRILFMYLRGATLFFTGHSLGGTTSILLGAEVMKRYAAMTDKTFEQWKTTTGKAFVALLTPEQRKRPTSLDPKRFVIMTIGSPLNGNKEFKTCYETSQGEGGLGLRDRTLRIVNGVDAVTRVNPFKEWTLRGGKGGVHVGLEMVLTCLLPIDKEKETPLNLAKDERGQEGIAAILWKDGGTMRALQCHSSDNYIKAAIGSECKRADFEISSTPHFGDPKYNICLRPRELTGV